MLKWNSCTYVGDNETKHFSLEMYFEIFVFKFLFDSASEYKVYLLK